MSRIAGVNLSAHKHIVISLRSIYGIGPNRAMAICKTAKVDPQTKTSKLMPDELEALQHAVNEYTVEGDLRLEVLKSIKELMDMGCYRGRRHRKHLPVRGQRTKTNAKSAKRRKR